MGGNIFHNPQVHWVAGALLVALLLLVFQAVDPPAWLPGDGEVELVSPGGGVQMQLAPNRGDSESGPGYLTGPTDDYTPTERWSENEIIRLDIGSIAGPGYEMPSVENNAGNSLTPSR